MSKPTTTEKPKTQLQRAKLIRERYLKWFPILDELKTDLNKLLDEPPDKTIFEVQRCQLQGISEATRHLLLSLLFDTKEMR